MIITFSVRNFRSIRDKVCLDLRATTDKTLSDYYVLEIPKPKISVLKMAMLYGANATGKTNILLALNWLRSFIMKREANKEEPINIDPFALDEDKPSEFEIQFLHNGIVYHYQLELDRRVLLFEKLTHYPKGREALVFERRLINADNDYEYSYTWTGAEISTEQRKNLELAVQNQAILSKVSSIKYSGSIQYARDWFRETLAPIVKPTSGLVMYNFDSYLKQDEGCKNLRFFLDQLKKADFMINELNIKEEEIPVSTLPAEVRELFLKNHTKTDEKDTDTFQSLRLLLTHGNESDSFQLELSEESAGTKRYFEFIGLMCELINKNRIVPIDEIESSLHIELQLHYITLFLRNASRGQLIFTSHNTALLNERDLLRRDAIWITDRNPDGSTKLTSVADFSLRKEHAIDKVYRRGLLGGVPNLGTTYLEDDDEG